MKQAIEKDTFIEVPKGYMMDAEGRLVHKSKVSQIDLDRDALVKSIVDEAKEIQDPLKQFKRNVKTKIESFIEHSAKAYKAKMGGKKGNVTLYSYDGQYKVMRANSDLVIFDERIQMAKSLIDECILAWSKGSNVNIKILVQDAFQVNAQGNISKEKVLGLKRHKIDDPKWKSAMQAITDSMKVISSKSYIRIYERDAEGEYQPVSLDLASV